MSVVNILIEKQKAVCEHGISVFGTESKFYKWLESENFYFDKNPPGDYFDSLKGLSFIDDQLTNIEYGNLA